MTRRTILSFCLALLLLSGCAHLNDDWDKPLGENGFKGPLGAAYYQQLEAQKFDPVPATADPVVGLNGKLSQSAMGKYQTPKPEDNGPSFNEVVKMLMNDKKN